jgi:hypothetical protein
VLFVLQQLSIFLGLGAPAPLASGAALATAALLLPGCLFILAVDLGHDLADLGVRVRLDEVAEQIGKA